MRKVLLTVCLATLTTTSAVALTALRTLPAGAAVTSDGGSLPIGSASYPVPASALYVATNGRDTNTGAIGSPFATVTRAAAVATNGQTIVVRGGVYHESVNIGASHQVIVENYPGEAVWFDGTTSVPGWTRSASTWIHTGWNHHFDHTPGYSPASASVKEWLDPAYPMAAHPDQVWVGGRWLQQVSSSAQVVTGTFYYDEPNNTLVIGSDPTGKSVVASALGIAFTVRSDNTVLRGFGVRRYATSIPDNGAIRLWGAGDTLSNMVVSEIATSGISISKFNATITHVTGMWNGLVALHANEAYGLMMDDLLIHHNNREHFSSDGPVEGGLKIAKSRGVTLRNSVIRDQPDASGAWFDQSSYDVTVTGNRITNNGRIGLDTEISSNFTIADNYIVGNGKDQIRIFDTNQVKVWNNTLGGGNSRAVGITQDERVASDTSMAGHDNLRPLPDPTVTWLAGQVVFSNNVVGQGAIFHVLVLDHTGNRSASQMNVTVDGNLFSPQPAHYGDVGWGQSDGVTVVRYVTAYDVNHSPAGGTRNADNPTSMPAAQLQVSPAARSNAAALPIPSDVAAKIGQPAGTLHLGSF